MMSKKICACDFFTQNPVAHSKVRSSLVYSLHNIHCQCAQTYRKIAQAHTEFLFRSIQIRHQ